MSTAVAEPATADAPAAAGMEVDTTAAQPAAPTSTATAAAAAAAEPTAPAAAGGSTPDAAAGCADGPAQAQAAAAAAATAAAGDESKPKKQTKRKVAMHLAYLGAGYHGMQRNPGCRTIESELESALTKAGAISEQNAGSFHKIHWNRAARTDKGVSALCQVVSAKLMVEPKDTFAERVNQHLPKQIRVFGVHRATEGFDARKFCDKRKYEYILPAWAFDPQAASQKRAEQQSTAQKESKKGSSDARLADEAAALQAIAAAVMAAEVPGQQQQQQQQVAEAGNGDGAAADGEGGEPSSSTAAAAAAAGGGSGSAANGRPSSSSGVGGADELASTSKVGKDVLHRMRQDIAASCQRFVFGASQLERLNSLLRQYEGTHNYHNYTVRVLPDDPAASRYIISFGGEVIHIQGQPWVRLVVVGQSFMLHQIRKMVGMVLAIMRGAAPESCLQLALEADRDFNTPMAPELGLFLDETYYDAYNNRFGELHGPISFEPHRQAATDFKNTILYKHIAALDDKELINALWLRSCNDANYRFSKWSSQPKARDSSSLTQQQQNKQLKQQQQSSNGQDTNKRKQGDRSAASPAAEQQQQQQPQKQQRLERPGKLDGASAAMVVGMQETYGMRPHSDTQQAAEFRRELKEMRDQFAQVQQQQQQQQQTDQQQQPPAVLEVAEEELDSLYD